MTTRGNLTSLFDDGNDDATRARGDAREAGRRGIHCDSGARDDDDDDEDDDDDDATRAYATERTNE
jgi:hypothetical protein